MIGTNDQATSTSDRRAFTLVELVVVMAILGVVAAIAVPRMGASMTRRRLDNCEHRLIADFDMVRRLARAQSSSVTMTFSAAQDDYTVTGLTDRTTGAGSYTVDLTVPPYNAAIQSAAFGVDEIVVFNGFGLPDTTGTVVVAVGGETRTIALDSNGHASHRMVTPLGGGSVASLGGTVR